MATKSIDGRCNDMWGLGTHPLGRGPGLHNVVCEINLGACETCLPSRPFRHVSTAYVNSRNNETDVHISPYDVEVESVELGECSSRNRACNTAGPADASFALFVSDGIAFARVRNGRPGQSFIVNSIINGIAYAREVIIQ